MFIKESNKLHVQKMIDIHFQNITSANPSEFSNGFIFGLRFILTEFQNGGVRSGTTLLRYLDEKQIVTKI